MRVEILFAATLIANLLMLPVIKTCKPWKFAVALFVIDAVIIGSLLWAGL